MDSNDNQTKYEALSEMTKGNYKAFLYDCDGTLADNMEAHKESYVAVAAKAGVNITGEIVDELAGLPIPEVVEKINERFHSSFDPLEFEKQKSTIFIEQYVPNTVPIKFVVDHLKASAGKYRIGVVSGGTRNVVQKTLEALGVAQLVEVMVCAGETKRGKPFPDPFLEAAKQLNVEPELCVVFEDGNAGVQSAIAAGMKWIRVDKV